MAKKGQNQVKLWMTGAFIAACLPVLLSHQSWAQNCTKTEIQLEIKQFKDVKQAKAAVDAIVQCGENAIAPLEQALHNSKADIRTHAASALGKMGATAQDAADALVAALADSESVVRTKAASALIQIGRAVQKEEIVSWDVSAVEKLKTFQQKLADAQKKAPNLASMTYIARLNVSKADTIRRIDSMPKERGSDFLAGVIAGGAVNKTYTRVDGDQFQISRTAGMGPSVVCSGTVSEQYGQSVITLRTTYGLIPVHLWLGFILTVWAHFN